MSETEVIFSVQESPEGRYEARALGYPIFTQADTLDQLEAMASDALECHFDRKSVKYVLRLRPRFENPPALL